MDQIDLNLLEAWCRVSERLRRDPAEALRRWQRLGRARILQTMRATCLVVRASDTRLSDVTAVIDPPRAWARKEEHDVELTGALVRRLCAPVRLEWPGLHWKVAAARLGRPHQSISHWIRNGWLEVSYAPPSMVNNAGGKPVPIVWSPHALDPNARRGAPPHSIWGSLWMHRAALFPAHYVQVVRRAPVWQRSYGKRVFRGWRWLCPGRFVPIGSATEAREPVEAEHQGHGHVPRPCGRRCRYLYAPMPVWTLAQATGIEHALAMPAGSGLAGAWHPGTGETPVGAGRRTFACGRCWNVVMENLRIADGWNDFVARLSGGMLYGREVPWPVDLVPRPARRRARRHRTTRRGGDSAARRDAG